MSLRDQTSQQSDPFSLRSRNCLDSNPSRLGLRNSQQLLRRCQHISQVSSLWSSDLSYRSNTARSRLGLCQPSSLSLRRAILPSAQTNDKMTELPLNLELWSVTIHLTTPPTARSTVL